MPLDRSSTTSTTRMAAKSKPVGRSLVVISFLSVLLVCGQEGLAVNAQTPDDGGKRFLDNKEAYVLAIARNATANNNNCEGLNNCGSSCSRVTCHPPSGGDKFLTCGTVDKNEHFNLCSRGSCNNTMRLDYTQSFVTLPAPGSTILQPEIAQSICLQKPLEPTFKSISLQTAYSLVYFGSVTGAFRAFPGREQNNSQCTGFDTRRRPWYLNGISVNKDVKILVDVAVSMGKQVPIQYSQDSSTTFLNVAKNITRALLQTFSPGDFVEVISYDSQGATSLTGAPVYVDASFDYTIPDRPELLPLITKVNSMVASQEVGPSNLTGAILKSTQSFKSANFSRVIIVLTDGLFAPVDAAFPTQMLVSSQTKLMIYKLDTYDTDKYLLNTALEKTVCSVSGSFEVLDPLTIPNPLYAVRSYFTFLAQTQLVAAKNKSTWSFIYASVSQDLNAITVTFPAFGNDGQLIGVAGADVVVDGLNKTLQGLVLSDFVNRRQGTLPVPATIPLTCSYQKAAATGYCSSSPTANNSAICQDIDNSISLAARTCCGDCGGGGGGGGLSTGAQAGIGIGAVVAFGLVLCGGYLLIKWLITAPPEFKFKGPPEENPENTSAENTTENGKRVHSTEVSK